ncbi:hypothetical protein [Nonomuraea sp. NPDC005692]|uniref:hypothetical protein n=1 Tax=Nonomuraea sp. NPDC005692 TaxID=3157168 RepID=UPI0033EA0DF6
MTTFLDGAVADPERFSALFDAHYEEIRSYIGRRLDLDVAKGGVRPWLYGIATKLIGRHRRAEFRRYRAEAGGSSAYVIERLGWTDDPAPKGVDLLLTRKGGQNRFGAGRR